MCETYIHDYDINFMCKFILQFLLIFSLNFGTLFLERSILVTRSISLVTQKPLSGLNII